MYKKYLKKTMADFKPYQCEKYINNALRLDMNTPLDPPACYNDFIKYLKANKQVNLYFDPSYTSLKKAIADYEKVEPNQIVVGNSGDEIIDIITKAFLEKNDKFIISSPTYSMFEIQGKINGGKMIDVPLLKDCSIDSEKIVEQKAKIVFICNPNNPTGTISNPAQIEKVVKNFKGIVIIDEAYGEYYGKSFKKLVNKYDNLIITKTFSKFASIAGARVGYLITNKNLAKILDGVRLPYGVSYFSLILAEMVLKNDQKYISKLVKKTKSERQRMKMILQKNNIKFLDSQANFLFIYFGNKTKRIVAKLKKQGLIVRNFSKKYQAIRITVSTDCKINNKLIKIIL